MTKVRNTFLSIVLVIVAIAGFGIYTKVNDATKKAQILYSVTWKESAIGQIFYRDPNTGSMKEGTITRFNERDGSWTTTVNYTEGQIYIIGVNVHYVSGMVLDSHVIVDIVKTNGERLPGDCPSRTRLVGSVGCVVHG